MITSDLLNSDVIRHGFFTKEGGVSTGIYNSLNCGAGSSDDPEAVKQNKATAMGKLGLPSTALRTLYQIHSADVVIVDETTDFATPIQADAMVTKTPGIALGILTADCVPILFADMDNKVIGAAHSGWKGTLGNITSNVIASMCELGADRSKISAVIGPSIQQKSYEVGPDFPNPFVEENAENAKFFIPSQKQHHHMFDLTGYVKAQLDKEGLEAVALLDLDTYTEEDQFFSYRRMCHRSESDYGRQLSAIALTM